MKVITIVRKPTEGTTTQNVIDHGCGALNIDACRITYQSPTDQDSAKPQGRATAKIGALAGKAQNERERTEFEANNTKGRWPANLILQHQPGCQQTGSTTAPGYTINRWTDGAKPFGGGAGHEYESEAQPDETVAVWACAEGCPVADLEGIKTSVTGKRSQRSQEATVEGTKWLWNNHKSREYPGESGSAARFFKQVKP